MFEQQRNFHRARVFVAAASIMLAASAPAWAGLGGDLASIQADEIRMQGKRETMAAASYTVHEIQAGSGTVVREYVSSSGKVFAVSFHGPWLPDMRQLLGNYFEQYSRAAQSQNGTRLGRHPVMIEEPGLTVQIGGHSRAFAGRAFNPELFPAGVSAQEIQ